MTMATVVSNSDWLYRGKVQVVVKFDAVMATTLLPDVVKVN